MQDFREQILDQMKLKGISRGNLSQLTGLHYFTICRYLAGKTEAKAKTRSRMLEALGL